MSTTAPHSTRADVEHPHSLVGSSAALAPGVAVTAIWVSTLLISIFAPDLVSGSQQEHLPIAGFTAWPWAAAATGYVLMATRVRDASDDPRAWLGFELSIVVIWAVVALAGIFAPELVTGSDPTRVPLAALVTPVAGLVATGFVALHATTARTRR